MYPSVKVKDAVFDGTTSVKVGLKRVESCEPDGSAEQTTWAALAFNFSDPGRARYVSVFFFFLCFLFRTNTQRMRARMGCRLACLTIHVVSSHVRCVGWVCHTSTTSQGRKEETCRPGEGA